jgi:hypothetical protein
MTARWGMLSTAGIGRQAHEVHIIRFKGPSAVLQGLTPAGVTAVKQVPGYSLTP